MADAYEAQVQRDVAELAEDPFARAKWADGMFEVIALAYVFRKMADAFDVETETPEKERNLDLAAHAEKMAMLSSRPKSSATCSNLIDLCEKAAWAEVAPYLRGHM